MSTDRTQQTTLDPESYAANQPIRAVNWQQMNRQTNFIYATSGVIIASLAFEPAFTTALTTFTTNNSTSNGQSLDTFRPCFSLRTRAQVSGVDKVIFKFQTYGRFCDVRFTVVRDQSTAIGNATVLGGTPYAHRSVDLQINWASVFEGGSTANPFAVLSLYVEAKATTSGAELLQIAARSKLLDSSEIPITE